jgi:hypothetical protein
MGALHLVVHGLADVVQQARALGKLWTSAPSSAAIMPAMWLTSMECCSTFWP